MCRRKGENNINNAWQHIIFIYFYRCKADRPTLIAYFIVHIVDEWGLFIDFLKRDLKALFLNVGN